MFRLMVMHVLLICLMLLMTSSASGTSKELPSKSRTDSPTEPEEVTALWNNKACSNHGGYCVRNGKTCPEQLPYETSPGKPFCTSIYRCCYSEPCEPTTCTYNGQTGTCSIDSLPGTIVVGSQECKKECQCYVKDNSVSCSLVWNHTEHRPLIMIRQSKTIVPPIIDKEISDDPNRIPTGEQLIFACPGDNNQFNHVNGMHTKLHGECTAHEQFKVCVNNNPEFLNLSQLSCSSRMFPSFIKDNDTSVKSCDGIGGELYKTGYTYGDYHEFKDLEIEVCFRKKNHNTLCTNPNLNGNETDYKSSRGFLAGPIEGRDTRVVSTGSKSCGECGHPKQLCKQAGTDIGYHAKCNRFPENCGVDDDGKKLVGPGYCNNKEECYCCLACSTNGVCKDKGFIASCRAKATNCGAKNDGTRFEGPGYCGNNNDCYCCVEKDCGKPKQNCEMKGENAYCLRTADSRDCTDSGGKFTDGNDMCLHNTCGCCVPNRFDIKQDCNDLGKAAKVKPSCIAPNEKCNGGNGKIYTGDQYCVTTTKKCCVPIFQPAAPCNTINYSFYYKHVCENCGTTEQAFWFIKSARKPDEKVGTNADGTPILISKSTVFTNVKGDMEYKVSTFHNGIKTEDTCQITAPVMTWDCKIKHDKNNKPYWAECEDPRKCKGEYAQDNGHFFPRSLDC